MITELPVSQRALRSVDLPCDFAVVGGGLAGVCAAITAAREGLRVVLLQDRPVLGGNSSSEVRLWVLGATSHMGNNNRWAREGGVIDELLVENLWRNPEGNPLMFDLVLLEKVIAEPNLTLLLNTAAYEVEKAGEEIAAVRAFNAQNSTLYTVRAPLFCDASGDGIVGFLSGAAFRMGAESREEFGEGLAPDASYGELLGHSIYFYSKDTGRPVKFVPPAFALQDITTIPRWRHIGAKDMGCRLWWFEYGGRHDTVHATEEIKWELWKVVYGAWNHIKNSGLFPEAENLTLEWVGTVPGKRESRRFEGPVILTQQDLVKRNHWDDTVAFGGWSLDLHPADGVYAAGSGCNQWHSRSAYEIPYRCYFSRNIPNLFLAGRVISVSHVAFSSTRVMGTSAHGGQAVGMAAVHCFHDKLRPADLVEPKRMAALQNALLRNGQHLPRLRLRHELDQSLSASVTGSSTLRLGVLPTDGRSVALDAPWGMFLPLPVGPVPKLGIIVDAPKGGVLRVELRCGVRPDDHTPSEVLATLTRVLEPGLGQALEFKFPVAIDQPRYVLLAVFGTAEMAVQTSAQRLTGVLAVSRRGVKAVSSSGAQIVAPELGVDSFEFWTPQRRPEGRNLALTIDPPLDVFRPENILDGVDRPTDAAHAWLADLADPSPTLELKWDAPRTISSVDLWFDSDFDHPLESALYGHPERAVPFMVSSWTLKTGDGHVLATARNQRLSRAQVTLGAPISTDRLILECGPTHGGCPAAVFAVRVW